MIAKIKKLPSFLKKILATGLFLWPGLASAAVTLTTDEQKRCAAFKAKFSDTIFANMPDQYCSMNALLLWLLQQALIFAGTVTVLFIVVGGFWYLTSGGNEEQAEKGKKTLINSVIGLVVIILATTIVRIVANTLAVG